MQRCPLPMFAVPSLLLLGACRAESAPTSPPTEDPSPSAALPAAPPVGSAVGPAFCRVPTTGARLPRDAQAELVADGFTFVEGPVWSERAGAFFFSEMDVEHVGPNGPGATIHQLVLPDAVSTFVEQSGSNGLAIDADGLVACTHDTQTLSRFDLQTKARTTYVEGWQGKRFNSPNDVALHADGHAYFTDPDWQLGPRASETGMTGVYWRKPSGEVELVDDGRRRPNGIALSLDQTKLFVGAADGSIHVYPVNEDGGVGPGAPFAHVEEPDGMSVDCAGNLYVTSHGPGLVQVLAPDGSTVSTIEVAPKATNVAFGGPDRQTMLITAGGGVYAVAWPVPGLPY